MSRMVSIYLPHLPLERLKRAGKALTDDRPFALVGSEERGLLLTAVNGASAAQGLIPGMGLADARAICPHLLTAPAEARKDADALLDLASWASLRYSPTLNVDGDDGLWLDVTGVAHLFGGEAELLADLEGRLARAGLTARLALAETLGGAHALARFARTSPIVVPHGKITPALAGLPVEALRLEPEIAHLLRRLGLKRIGQLYTLPRASLERRFHAKDVAEAVLLRLDQALGEREEKRAPLRPAADFTVRLPFPEPLITHEGVLAGLDYLAEELCALLARKGRGARRLALWLCRSDGSSAVVEAGLSAPSRERRHLLNLFKDKIEEDRHGLRRRPHGLHRPRHRDAVARADKSRRERGEGGGRASDRPPGQSLGHPRRTPPLAPRKPYPRIGAKHAERLDGECLGTKCLGTRRFGLLGSGRHRGSRSVLRFSSRTLSLSPCSPRFPKDRLRASPGGM